MRKISKWFMDRAFDVFLCFFLIFETIEDKFKK